MLALALISFLQLLVFCWRDLLTRAAGKCRRGLAAICTESGFSSISHQCTLLNWFANRHPCSHRASYGLFSMGPF
jgi:hypothetical protein